MYIVEDQRRCIRMDLFRSNMANWMVSDVKNNLCINYKNEILEELKKSIWIYTKHGCIK